MKLHQNVVREPSDVRKTLILLDTQWESDYVYAAAYFDYKTSLFFISEEGTLSRSKTVYPYLERVDPEEFNRIVAGSFLISDSTAMKYLAPIIDPEGPTDRR